MLEQRAQAVLSGDREGFLATVSERDPEFYSAQETLFEHLQPLPFASFEFAADKESGFVDTQRSDWRIRSVNVMWQYSWTGFEDEVRTEELDLDLAQENGVWKLTGDQLSEEGSWWILDHIAAERSNHFLLFYHPDFQPFATEAIAVLEAEYDSIGAAVEAATGEAPRPGYAAFISSSQEEFRQLAGGGAHTQGLATWEYALGPDGMEVLSRTLYLNGETLRDDLVAEFETAVRHEIGHLMLVRVTLPFTPVWLSEGAAMLLSDTEIDWGFLADTGLTIVEGYEYSVESLTDDASLGGFPFSAVRGHVQARYEFSNAINRYLVDNFGSVAYWRFYMTYADTPWREIEPVTRLFGPGKWNALKIGKTDEALRDIFGLSELELDKLVRDWIREQAAI